MAERARRHRVICAGRPVPDGWVVVGRYHNLACPGDGDNALIIKQPGACELVCDGSPVPDGYVAVRRARLDACPGDGDNGWLIERADGRRGR